MSKGRKDPQGTGAQQRPPTGAVVKTRYVVGIDLGTTNTALAYVDRRSGRKARAVRPFPVPQHTEPGLVESLRGLPSAAYVRGGHELSAEQVRLPWDQTPSAVVGELARRRGTLSPDRLITSAKSWLCHPGVDRKAAILPWGAPEEVQKRSPVEVEALLLRHLREAWDYEVAAGDPSKALDRQDIVVTIPASFDEVARELTVAAVRQAGLEALLIEEPQAALYAWIAAHEEEWPQQLAPGERVLVCDVGGGTSDFSLIEVVTGADGEPGFERTAVGEHLLLGGDNMDLALARRVEARLGKSLDPRSWQALVAACREAKVRLLEGERDEVQLSVAKRGAKLVGATLRAKLTQAEVTEAILEGFFPLVAPDEPPRRRRRGAGLKEFGLPFEAEPAITRHLRDFLARHGGGEGLAHVDRVLFNGGVFKTAALRARVLDALAEWQERPAELTGSDLDLAVSRGAAYYGLVRRGKGTRIRGGAGRGYYLEVGGGADRVALCLIPRGLEEGGLARIEDRPLELKANRPVVFPFHTATDRDDAAGAVVALDDEAFEELSPLHTVIRLGRKRSSKARDVPVTLVARYTEIGTLEMWAEARESERRWRLELDTRPREAAPAPAEAAVSSSGRHAPVEALPPQDGGPPVDPAQVERATRLLRTALELPASAAQRPLEKLGRELEEALGGAREGWPVAVIRALADALLEVKETRTRSPFHEARWWNLMGFSLRPGFGATLDEFRVSEVWKLYLQGIAHPRRDSVVLEWWVAWRRICGGLNRGQQETLFSPLQPALLQGKARGASKQVLAESWRLAASLEHLSPKKKRQLGEQMIALLEKGKAPPRWGPWALGRLGGRTPLYGPLDRLVSGDVAANWLRRLLKLARRGQKGADNVFAVVQLARLTDDRSRDVPGELRQEAVRLLEERGVEPRTIRPLQETVRSEVRTQQEFYGDSVPIGLVLKSGA